MLNKLCPKLMESMPVGIILADSGGKLLFVNERAVQILGCEPEELASEAPWLVQCDDSTDSEHRIEAKSGEVKWVARSWSSIMDDDGARLILSVIHDITNQKLADDCHQEILRNVSHEVRTPLTAVIGYAEMLMEGIAGEVNDEQSELLGRVLTNSNHLLDVVNDILQTARFKNGGKIALNPKECNPGHIVDKSISAVLPQARQKGLAINVYSKQTECFEIYDEEKLVIILTNLLANAVKYTDTGSIDVTITCLESGVEIIVADTGIGIAAADLSSIFDEFQQLDHPRKHKTSGFGVGLAIVATMVEAIGAGLTVSSEPGLGTAFTLSAPILEE